MYVMSDINENEIGICALLCEFICYIVIDIFYLLT